MFRKYIKKMLSHIVTIQKNLRGYMWRKNYRLLKRGMIKLQRLFRSKKDVNEQKILSEYYGQKRIVRILKEKANELVSNNIKSSLK